MNGKDQSRIRSSASILRTPTRNQTPRYYGASRNVSPVKEPPACRLDLVSVIGNTAISPVGFASCSYRYVYLAGSLAVVNTVRDDDSVHQTFHGSIRHDTPNGSSDRGSHTPIKPGQTSSSNVAKHSSLDTDFGSLQVSARQRTRSASCVAISADGLWLAVGETGFAPGIHIYFLADLGQETPMYVLREHEIGVRCLAISPDGKWLCSVGELHDGNIYLWDLSSKKVGRPQVRALNKCTADVRSVCFLGSKIVTVGLRHIKLWSYEIGNISPVKAVPDWGGDTPSRDARADTLPSALSGRNCLLGDLVDPCFQQISAVDSQRALVCTKSGELFMLSIASETSCELSRPIPLPGSICCFAYVQSLLMLFGAMQDGTLYKIDLDIDSLREVSLQSKKPVFEKLGLICIPGAICIACVQKKVLVLDSDRIFHAVPVLINAPLNAYSHVLASSATTSHNSPILGIVGYNDHLHGNLGFLTWTSSGHVLVWNSEGHNILALSVCDSEVSVSQQGLDLEGLRVVRLDTRSNALLCGYRNGFIAQYALPEDLGMQIGGSELRLDEKNRLRWFRGHETALTTILLFDFNSTSLVASGGRDRMLQIYTSQLELIQTCDFHNGAITDLLFIKSKDLLASSSTDRSLALSKVCDAGASGIFVAQYRIFSFRSTPLSMTLSSAVPGKHVIMVSTADKSLYTCDTEEKSSSLHLTDDESGENVALSHMTDAGIAAIRGSEKFLLGINNVDKSVRIHDATTGATMSKAYGHSEGVVGIVLVPNTRPMAVTVGLDGVIMLWSVVFDDARHAAISDNLMSPEVSSPSLSLSSKPLRRVLSRQTLQELIKPHASSPLLEKVSASRNRSPIRLPYWNSKVPDPESPLAAAPTRRVTKTFEHSVQSQPPGRRLLRQQTRSVGNLRRDEGPSVPELISYLRKYRRNLDSAVSETDLASPELLLELRQLLDRLER